MSFSHSIDFGVKEAGGKLAPYREKRSVRLLPNGKAGVIYNGRGYPLYDNQTIDLSDRGFPIDSCSEPIALGEPLPVFNKQKSAQRFDKIDWYYEENPWNSFIAFNGTDKTKDHILLGLEVFHITALKAGRSYRPAKNGIQYDWYIKLKEPASYATIRRILGNPENEDEFYLTGEEPKGEQKGDPELLHRLIILVSKYGSPVSDALGAVEWLESNLDVWQEHIGLLKSDIENIQSEKDRLLKESNLQDKESLKRLKAAIAEKEKLEGQLDGLGKENTELKKRLAEANEGTEKRGQARSRIEEEYRLRMEERIRELLLENSNLRKEQEDLLNEYAAREQQWSETIAKLRAEKESLLQDVDTLKGGRTKILGAFTIGKNRATVMIQSSIECFTDRLVISDDAYDSILRYFPYPNRLYEIMHAFDRLTKIESSGIKGAPGWFEVKEHITTGSDDRGRIYWRRRGPKDAFDIYVHYKEGDQEQQRLFDRLSELPYFASPKDH